MPGAILPLCLVILSALPACAGNSPRLPLTRQPIEEFGSNALAGFFASLADTETQRAASGGDVSAITRIVHYGDSHIAADLLTGVLRQHFQRDFGDAGIGFLPAGRPWAWYSRSSAELASSAGWQVNGLSQSSLFTDGRFGLSGISFTTDRRNETLRLLAEGAHFEILLLRQPGGGAVDVLLDERIQQRRFSLAADEIEPVYLELSVPSWSRNDNLHSLELRTVAAGAVRVLGLVAERHRAGVVYDAFGINGARATRLLQWNEKILADSLSWRDPDLIIVSYGSNEAGDADFDPIIYQQQFLAVLTRLQRAAPRASLLVLAPPDRAIRVGKRWRALSTMPGLVAAQRKAAQEAGAAFWNLYRAMGEVGSIPQWVRHTPPLAQPDLVHLTRDGYRLVADALYHELMNTRSENYRSLITDH